MTMSHSETQTTEEEKSQINTVGANWSTHEEQDKEEESSEQARETQERLQESLSHCTAHQTPQNPIKTHLSTIAEEQNLAHAHR